MHFTLADIQLLADPRTLRRGEDYFRQGRVSILRAEHDVVIADVQGSRRRSYRTELFISDSQLCADCTCPVAMDCKHGVAVALAWLQQAPAAPGSGLEEWLGELEAASAVAAEGLKAATHHLIYQLELAHWPGEDNPQAHLVPMKGYLKKDGSWSQLKEYGATPYHSGYPTASFLKPVDEDILTVLSGRRAARGYRLTGELGAIALQRALACGRLYHPGHTAPLQPGPERPLTWAWSRNDEHWELQAQLDDLEHWHYIGVDPPWYLHPARGELGPLSCEIPSARQRLLVAMPPVAPGELGRVSRRLRTLFPPEALPLPEEPDVVSISAPVPELTLVAPQGEGGFRVPGAVLHFRYGPVQAAPNYDADSLRDWTTFHRVEGQDYEILRDFEQEIRYCDQLADLGLALLPQLGRWHHVWVVDADRADELLVGWRELEKQALPELEAQGWQITAVPDYGIPVQAVQMDLRIEDAEHSWFDFELTLKVGDQSLPTEELVARWLECDAPDELLLPTKEGWLQLDAGPLQPLRDLIESIFREESLDGAVRLPPFRAAQLSEVTELDDRAAPLTRQLAERLRQFRGRQDVPVSPQLHCALRPYQHEGLNWLYFLQQYGFGGILADDMGLGKTLQVLALLQHLKDNGQLQRPALVVAPTSVAGNWLREAGHFAPALDVLLLHGPRRYDDVHTIDQRDVLVTTYPLLLRDQALYESRRFAVAVLDEAQAIKNPDTKLARAARALQADCRLCLSGTPLENHLGELWSLMDFALPGLLGQRQQFRQQFRTPIEAHGDRERQQQLARRVAPFLLRRTKAEVVRELPPKSETIEYVELGGRQRTLYEGIRISMQKRIRDIVARKGMARSRIEFLDALLKLRQACIDPRLVKLDKAQGISESAKLEWLRVSLPQLIEEGRRLLVFSQFIEVLQLVEQELKTLGLGYSKLTGRTRKRQQTIDRFQRGEVPVFLISLKAGGSGLNLTAADVVIHLDPWWNPAVEAQASDRAHRIGQDKPVFVYKLIAAGTVEERIQQLQAEKRALAETLFDDTGAAALPQDGEALLALLE